MSARVVAGHKTDLGRHQGVGVGDIAEVLLPVLLPRLLSLHRVGVGDIADALGIDWIGTDVVELVRPIKTAHQRNDLGVVGEDDADHLFDNDLPLGPADLPELAVVGGGLVEKLVERYRWDAGVAERDIAPEVVGLLAGGVVHGVLEDLGPEVADAVPLDVEVETELGGPGHRLVEELEILDLATSLPSYGVDRHADEVRPPVLDDLEVGLAPAPVLHQLVGVGDVDSPEDPRVAILVDKAVALDVDELLGGLELRSIEGLWVWHVPPVPTPLLDLAGGGQRTPNQHNRTHNQKHHMPFH